MALNLFNWIAGAQDSQKGTTTAEGRTTDTKEAQQQQESTKRTSTTSQLDAESLKQLKSLFGEATSSASSLGGVDLSTMMTNEANRPAVDVSALINAARVNAANELQQTQTKLGKQTGSTFNTAVQQALAKATGENEANLAATEAQLQSSVGASEANRLASLLGSQTQSAQNVAVLGNLLKGAKTTTEEDTTLINEIAKTLLGTEFVSQNAATDMHEGSTFGSLLSNLGSIVSLGQGTGSTTIPKTRT